MIFITRILPTDEEVIPAPYHAVQSQRDANEEPPEYSTATMDDSDLSKGFTINNVSESMLEDFDSDCETLIAEEEIEFVEKDLPPSTQTPTPPHLLFETPPTFLDLIDYMGPEFFKRLSIQDVIRARGISRDMTQFVDNYFLNRVLPKTVLRFHSKHFHDVGYPAEREYQILLPVIRRIDKDRRFLPYDRVIYEPDVASLPVYSYRIGKFEPVAIDIHLDDHGKYRWPLIAAAADDSRPSHRQYRSRKIHLKHTKKHQYYRFDTFRNSPVHVFYKEQLDDDPNIVKVHAISIPLTFLRRAIYNKHGYIAWEAEIPRSNR